MNFYKHHIGDYAQATAHLSFVEDAAYSRMLRKYYADEKPLSSEVKAVQRLIGARTRDEKEAVTTVLEEFFELRDDGWHNRRGDAELAKANAQAETNRRIAEERESKKKERQQHGALNGSSHESLNDTVNDSFAGSGSETVSTNAISVEKGRKKIGADAGTEINSSGDGVASNRVSPRQHSIHEHESLSSREPSQTPDTRHQTPDTISPSGIVSSSNTSTSSSPPAGGESPLPVDNSGSGDPEKLPPCPHLEVLRLWAEVLPRLPQHDPEQWNPTRRKHLQTRWRDTAEAKGWKSKDEGLAFFRKLFGYIGKSQFLTGRAPSRDPNRPPFVIELEWLILPTNWAKVIEGKYHPET